MSASVSDSELIENHINPAIAKLTDMAKSCQQASQSQNALHFSQSVQNLSQSRLAIEGSKSVSSNSIKKTA